MTEVKQSILDQIDDIKANSRVTDHKQLFYDGDLRIASERARLAMESWQETDGEPPETRQAKKLKKIAEGNPVVIFPHQLIVGSITKFYRGANPGCDYNGDLLAPMIAEGQITMGGPETVGITSQEDMDILIECDKYFKGKTAGDAVKSTRAQLMGTWYDEVEEAGGVQRTEGYPAFPGVVQTEKVLKIGLRGVINESKEHIKEFIKKQDGDLEALDFWQASIIACEAAITLSKRYAQCARDMAAKEKNEVRRAELTEIAEVCDWVPENPARTFHEAMQCMTLVELAICLQRGVGGTGGWAHVDQCMYPYFMRDLEAGTLTMQKAADLIGGFFNFVARRERVSHIMWRDYSQKTNLGSISVGGLSRDGKEDLSNELTYLILHVTGILADPEPHIPIRWHSGTPRWLMRKAMETNVKVGGGVPQFQNSEHITNYLMSVGVSAENARDWCGQGCSQAEPWDQRTSMVPTYMNTALPVDLALHNGVAHVTGKNIGVDTGDPTKFEKFEQFFDAYKTQCETMMRRCMWHVEFGEKAKAITWRDPMSSSLLPGCIDKGRDFMRGGLTHYRNWNMKDRGLIPAADSLMVVKKLVFDEKKLTMKELTEAVDSNFEGERGEEIRLMCLAVPKYGNDNDEADEMVRVLGKFTGAVISSTMNMFGFPYTVNRNGQAWHYANGKKMGALPNGRKAALPLADGSLSPTQGMDTNGPTALLSSALKADYKENVAAILNIKFPANLLASEEKRDKVIDLTEAYFKAGGTYIQFNLLDRKQLLDAKVHPENYKDLVVRVAGYSAYFTALSPDIQDEIINRTEHAI